MTLFASSLHDARNIRPRCPTRDLVALYKSAPALAVKTLGLALPEIACLDPFPTWLLG
jgi:hypothetical protein